MPALYGIDTRMLTKKLRDGGASLATVTFNDTTMPFDDPNSRNLVAEVSCTEPKVGQPPTAIAHPKALKLVWGEYVVWVSSV